jgi:hypothetical protein
VLTAVKLGLEAFVSPAGYGVPSDLDGVCARAAAVIRGRGGGRPAARSNKGTGAR